MLGYLLPNKIPFYFYTRMEGMRGFTVIIQKNAVICPI